MMTAPELSPPFTETVLVVEDEAAVRKFCCAVLRRSGYCVLEASGPVEALEAIQNAEKRVKLVLTDITMPVMSGREMVKRIDRTHLPNLRVVYMSGYSENIQAAGDLLEKPFTSADLLRRVRAAME
jgi:CheY-like chemotaxis protein